MIAFALRYPEEDNNAEGDDFGNGHGQPDSGETDERGQKEEHSHFHQEGAEKGNCRGDFAVAQRRKKGGTEDVEAAKNKACGVKTKAYGGHFFQLCITAAENIGDGACRELGGCCHDDGYRTDENQATAEKIFQLIVILCTVVIADYWGNAEGIAENNGVEHHHNIENYGNGSYAVFTGDTHKLVVIKKSNDGSRHIGNHFRGSVDCAVSQHPPFDDRTGQPQQAVVGEQEIDNGQDTADEIAANRSSGRTGNPPAENGDKKIVQNDVGKPRRNDKAQAVMGFFCGDEKGLKHDLEHIDGKPGQHDAAVVHAIVDDFFAGAEKIADRFNKNYADGGKHGADDHNHGDDHGKILTGALVVAFA